MSTTSKLGADKLTDEQRQAVENAMYGRTLTQANVFALADLLSARRPAAIGKQCTCKGVLGHSRQCAMFDESMMRIAAPLANEASKPAPSVEQDERGAFEAQFKMPVQCTRCDDGYAVTGYEAWDASAFILRWEGWQARAAYPSANVTQWESTAIANELWQLADQCGYEQFRDALSSHIKRAYQDGWQDRTTGVASVTYGEQK